MLWLLIFFLLIAAISPIMMMRQTPRQRRISNLRSAALSQGIKVGLVSRPDGRGSGTRSEEESKQYARYWIALDEPQQLPGAALHRIDSNGWESTYPGWVWRDKPKERQADPFLVEWLRELPGSILAMSWDGGSVGVLWSEQGEINDVALIADKLQSLKSWRQRLISSKT